MSFAQNLRALSEKAQDVKDDLTTEEATKTSLVMPFINALGYNVFDHREVEPEFVADVGTKKGEKVDYAIKRDDEIIMLFECKKASLNLAEAEFSQLYRYFGVTHTRIAVLTNGVQYRFFSDLEEPNKMDELPFLTVDIANLRDLDVEELKKLSKDAFDLERMLSTASDLKYLNAIKSVLEDEYEEPTEEFVKFFFSRVNPNSRFVSSAREQFTPLVQKGLVQFVRERVGSRLRNALAQEEGEAVEELSEASMEDAPLPDGVVFMDDDGVVTTEEEIEAFHIVKSICREVIEGSRIHHRDTKSYMGILVDDNNRRPICRLHFNGTQNYLGVFDVEKNEDRVAIDSVDDIYKYKEPLQNLAKHWVEMYPEP
jgi:hypothetical protein